MKHIILPHRLSVFLLILLLPTTVIAQDNVQSSMEVNRDIRGLDGQCSLRDSDASLLKDDYMPNIQSIVDNAVLDADGISCSLDGLEDYNIFGKTFVLNGIMQASLPACSTKIGSCGDSEIFLAKNQNGMPTFIEIKNKDSGARTTLIACEDDATSFHTLTEDSYDPEKLALIGFGDMMYAGNTRNLFQREKEPMLVDVDEQVRHLTDSNPTCSIRREVQVAIAYDARFCANQAPTDGIAAVQAIFAQAKLMYDATTCVELALTTVEGSCIVGDTPYNDLLLFPEGPSGCDYNPSAPVVGTLGYLQRLQTYWNGGGRPGGSVTDDLDVDAAHLFTGMFTDDPVVGCAFNAAVCTDSAYGANALRFSIDVNAIIFAHELGHNLDGSHQDPPTDHVMDAVLNLNAVAFNNGFASVSHLEFEAYLDTVACDADVPSTTAPTPPTLAPMAAPVGPVTAAPVTAPTTAAPVTVNPPPPPITSAPTLPTTSPNPNKSGKGRNKSGKGTSSPTIPGGPSSSNSKSGKGSKRL
eukprot:CAMPEP_0198304580 /NCGR_PEP_ID=MMETSP1449-20131203/57470_1 /TAXON_ID=420275 /ORGANISM="Attheya septentrionalis, Strain CCMP2084" /LENGTH=524 /DNA_ID=CAMNT_0044007105 /DNA_START=519 /DNA_END=2093 /DNA_ORIENTATION=+